MHLQLNSRIVVIPWHKNVEFSVDDGGAPVPERLLLRLLLLLGRFVPADDVLGGDGLLLLPGWRAVIPGRRHHQVLGGAHVGRGRRRRRLVALRVRVRVVRPRRVLARVAVLLLQVDVLVGQLLVAVRQRLELLHVGHGGRRRQAAGRKVARLVECGSTYGITREMRVSVRYKQPFY
jgi:hypothetical protein